MVACSKNSVQWFQIKDMETCYATVDSQVIKISAEAGSWSSNNHPKQKKLIPVQTRRVSESKFEFEFKNTSLLIYLHFFYEFLGFGQSTSRPGGFCCAARTYSRSQTLAVNAPKATSWMKPHQEITEDRLHVKVGSGDFLRCCSCSCDPQFLKKNWWKKGDNSSQDVLPVLLGISQLLYIDTGMSLVSRQL